MDIERRGIGTHCEGVTVAAVDHVDQLAEAVPVQEFIGELFFL